MRFDQNLRTEFQKKFGAFVFERESVKVFLRPYFTEELDPEKLVEQKENIFAQHFIQGFKDEEGIRDVIAFNSATEEDEPQQISYAFITKETPLQVLRRQKERIHRQINGLQRTFDKLDMKIHDLEDQVEVVFNESGELEIKQPSNS